MKGPRNEMVRSLRFAQLCCTIAWFTTKFQTYHYSRLLKNTQFFFMSVFSENVSAKSLHIFNEFWYVVLWSRSHQWQNPRVCFSLQIGSKLAFKNISIFLDFCMFIYKVYIVNWRHLLPTQIQELYSHVQWWHGNRGGTYPKKCRTVSKRQPSFS